MAGVFDLGNSSNPYNKQISDKMTGMAQTPSQATPTYNTKPVAHSRIAWRMTCKSWLNMQNTPDSRRYLIWACNPSDVSWTLNQRGVLSKNKTGTVLHVWRDRVRNTFYDEPILNLNLQAGNLMNVTVDTSGNISTPTFSRPTMAPGLDNFYQFLQLFDETKITPEGQGNFVTIQYGSRLFPNMTMTGMFVPDSLKFTDSSQTPNTVTSWTVSFQVYSTIPMFNKYEELVNVWKADGYKANLS